MAATGTTTAALIKVIRKELAPLQERIAQLEAKQAEAQAEKPRPRLSLWRR